jgi:hypothetical protein
MEVQRQGVSEDQVASGNLPHMVADASVFRCARAVPLPMSRLRFFLSVAAGAVAAGTLCAAPTVQTLNPAAGGTVNSLTQLAVTFSEPVSGVDADDLLINSETASSVTGSGAGPYLFTFTQPPPGTVNVAWDLDHGISGLGTGAFVAPLPWTYSLTDTIPPSVVRTTPANGATVGALVQVEVIFSEEVSGVSAGDLLLNGVAANSVTGSGLGPYIFTFTPASPGAVTLQWAPSHGIRDIAAAPNNFGGGNWTVTVNAAGPGNLIINEFLAVNGTGLLDENGDPEDWIEIFNPGATAVNLAGWALTNDADDLAKWVFPSRSIPANGYLVVFASGKNKTPASGNLHTNFTLNDSGGFLALAGPQFPRVAVSTFDDYPAQRTDYTFGQASGGAKRYFLPATPNAANSATSFTAVTPTVNASVGRGFFSEPFQLVLSCADSSATIRYTTDFTEPTASNGTVYSGPITINGTTIVRAVAFVATKIPSLPVTQSYIFLDHVLTQPSYPAGFPANWGPNGSFPGGVVPADYEVDSDPLRVDPNNVSSPIDPVKRQRLRDGLRELPIVSITIPMIDMFGTNGIYYSTHVQDKNFAYKKCAVEMVLPDGTSAFSTICGISGHGNASRDPLKNPKHGFQLKFKGDFGPSSLEYKLYPDSPVEEFDDIILRPDFNSSWRHWSDVAGNGNGAFQRTRATRLRDAFAKNTFRDMGGLASHHRFFHLFINGLYWGTYDFAEQPVDGFGESYLGGEKADYAIIHEGAAKNGADTVYTSMIGMANITTSALYEQMKGYLDLPQFIDYMLLHFYIGHQDWGNIKNWYALRRRASAANPVQGKYLYIPWDDECTLLEPNVNRVSSSDVPSGLHTKLVANAQYKLDFADRVHRHLIAPGGALTPTMSIARWQKWQAILDKAIVGESVRWGDYRRDVHQYSEGAFVLYTRENQWLAENSRLTTTYFPTRPATLLTQLRSAGLYPNVAAPEFRQNTVTGAIIGTSRVAAGSVIAINNAAGSGTIYYTTDGNDPHITYSPTTGANSSSVSATAQIYTAPLTVTATTTIKARVLSATGTWTALNEATFSVGIAAVPLAITEIMYNPPGGGAHEFIELLNYGTSDLDLGGYYFEGIEFVFPLGLKIGAGTRIVVASNNSPSSFAAQYPGIAVAGYFGGNLDNNGERIAVHAPDGSTVVSVTYSDKPPWPEGGGSKSGYSLEIINETGDPGSPLNWKTSTVLKGSPGTPNSPLAPSDVEISEVLAENVGAISNGGLFSDYVELHNTSDNPVALAGWVVDTGTVFIFPAGATIAPNEYVVLWLDNAATAPGFHNGGLSTLATKGGTVSLRKPDGKTADAVAFGNQITDSSIGRIAANWQLTVPSPGAANIARTTAAATGNLFVNEWFAASADSGPDWIEVYNQHASLPLALAGLYFQAQGTLDRFDALTFVAPRGFVQLFCDERSGPDQLDFKLPAEGATVSIFESNGGLIDTVSFSGQTAGVSQGHLPDGTGAITNFPNGGSPGAANYLINYNGAMLNEVLARNATGAQAPWGTRADWVELFNAGAGPFDMGGMRLGNTPVFADAWVIPAGTSVAAGGYLTIWCDAERSASTQLEPDLNSGRELTDDKGALYLFNSTGQLVDTVAWGFQILDLSIGRAAGQWQLLIAPTLESANAAPATLGAPTALRINEWFDGNGETDWFEIFNTDTAPVDLHGVYLTDDPSERGLSQYSVAPLNYVAPRGWVRFWCDGEIPFGGNQVNFALDGAGEYLRISAANLSLIDAVSFGAQNAGQSQGRIPDGASIVAGLQPTPAAHNLFPPTITDPPETRTVTAGENVTFTVTASGGPPLSYQWRFKNADLAGETGPSLTRNGVTLANDGAYTVVVSNLDGSVQSTAHLIVLADYAAWKAFHFNASEQADPNVSGPAADPDRDGLSNGQEFFHNLHPRIASAAEERASALPQVGFEPATGTPQFFTVTYRRSARAQNVGADHQISPSLSPPAWTTVAPSVIEQLGPDLATGDAKVCAKFPISAAEPARFFRLLITP